MKKNNNGRHNTCITDEQGQVKTGRSWGTVRTGINLLLLAALAAMGYLLLLPAKPVTSAPPAISAPPKTAPKARDLDALLRVAPKKLANIDIAEMNLLCASGLPGSEKLSVSQAMIVLDDWARQVASATSRASSFGYPQGEAHSLAETLYQVLRVELGVGLDPVAKNGLSFKDSRSAFIHGMILPGHPSKKASGGSVVSLPVIYVAVGRRLGYPLRLVTTKGHIFVRWDGDDKVKPPWREKFNIEVVQGFSTQLDLYYQSGPFKLTGKEIAANRYLVSLNAAEELAQFLAFRGHCALENGQVAFAARCYENAWGYDPVRPCYRDWFVDVAMRCGYKTTSPLLARLLAIRKSAQRQPDDAMAGGRRPGAGDGPAIDPEMAGIGNGLPGRPGPSVMPQLPGVGQGQPGLMPPRTSRQPPWNRPPQPGVPPR